MNRAFSRQDTYNSMADNITQDLDLPASLPPFNTAPNETNSHHHHHHHHHNNHRHPAPPPPHSKTPPHYQPPAPAANGPRPDDRDSNTPVVSLLSINHHQEKDYMSMRGGRRRQSGGPPLNGYSNAYPPVYSFVPNGEFRRSNGPEAGRYSRNSNKTRPRAAERRPNDHSSRSSLRTDSNSSASCADENSRNEEKRTPPPPPFYSLAAGNGREFHNASRYPNYRPQHHTNNNNNNNAGDKGGTAGPEPAPIGSNHNVDSTQTVSTQVHVGGGQQGFGQQARRSRRSIRRNGPSGVSEIGAGDAPLPNDDVCKKFETLKL